MRPVFSLRDHRRQVTGEEGDVSQHDLIGVLIEQGGQGTPTSL